MARRKRKSITYTPRKTPAARSKNATPAARSKNVTPVLDAPPTPPKQSQRRRGTVIDNTPRAISRRKEAPSQQIESLPLAPNEIHAELRNSWRNIEPFSAFTLKRSVRIPSSGIGLQCGLHALFHALQASPTPMTDEVTLARVRQCIIPEGAPRLSEFVATSVLPGDEDLRLMPDRNFTVDQLAAGAARLGNYVIGVVEVTQGSKQPNAVDVFDERAAEQRMRKRKPECLWLLHHSSHWEALVPLDSALGQKYARNEVGVRLEGSETMLREDSCSRECLSLATDECGEADSATSDPITQSFDLLPLTGNGAYAPSGPFVNEMFPDFDSKVMHRQSCSPRSPTELPNAWPETGAADKLMAASAADEDPSFRELDDSLAFAARYVPYDAAKTLAQQDLVPVQGRTCKYFDGIFDGIFK